MKENIFRWVGWSLFLLFIYFSWIVFLVFVSWKVHNYALRIQHKK